MTPTPDNPPDSIDALRAALAAERLARREAEARAAGAEAMVAHLKRIHSARDAVGERWPAGPAHRF